MIAHFKIRLTCASLCVGALLSLSACDSSDDKGQAVAASKRASQAAPSPAADEGPAPTPTSFTAKEKKEAKRLVEGMTRTQLAGFRNRNFAMPEERRRALLYLVRPEAQINPAKAALFELTNDRGYPREWSEAEREHLQASVTHWIGVQEMRADAVAASEGVVEQGRLPAALRARIIELAGSDAAVPERAAALQALTRLDPLGADAAKTLREAMEASEAQVRFAAVGANGGFADHETFWSQLGSQVAKLVADPHAMVRGAAVRAMVRSRQRDSERPDAIKAALPAVRGLLGHAKGALRCWGATFLEHYGEPEDVHRLAKLLDDTSSCHDMPEHEFTSARGGRTAYSLGASATSPAYAATEAMWALTPRDRRPSELGEGDRLAGKKAEAIALMKKWYAEQGASR